LQPGQLFPGDTVSTGDISQLNDAKTAYNTVAGLTGATVLSGDLGGMSLVQYLEHTNTARLHKLREY
jgi:hypothetical protein